jgi:hypothetical protein
VDPDLRSGVAGEIAVRERGLGIHNRDGAATRSESLNMSSYVAENQESVRVTLQWGPRWQ